MMLFHISSLDCFRKTVKKIMDDSKFKLFSRDFPAFLNTFDYHKANFFERGPGAGRREKMNIERPTSNIEREKG